MKIIILCFLVLPFCAIAQKQDASAIKVSGLNIQQLIKGFLQSGYSIKKSEGSLQYIFTAPKKLTYNIVAQLKAEIKKDCIILYGHYADHDNDNFKKIESSITDNELAVKSWEELQRFAVSFNKPLEYLKN